MLSYSGLLIMLAVQNGLGTFLVSSQIQSIKCVFNHKKTFECNFDVTDSVSYTCRFIRILGCNSSNTGPCRDTPSLIQPSNGSCSYSCAKLKYCKDGLVLNVTGGSDSKCVTICRKEMDSSIYKAGPVRNLKVIVFNSTALWVNWTKPADSDYDNDDYIYQIDINTDGYKRSLYKSTSENRVSVAVGNLTSWKRMELTVKARLADSTYFSHEVSWTSGNLHYYTSSSSDIENLNEEKKTFHSPHPVAVVIPSVVSVTLIVLIVYLICKRKLNCQHFYIVLPKDTYNDVRELHNFTDTRKQQMIPDSGRSTMDTANLTSVRQNESSLTTHMHMVRNDSLRQRTEDITCTVDRNHSSVVRDERCVELRYSQDNSAIEEADSDSSSVCSNLSAYRNVAADIIADVSEDEQESCGDRISMLEDKQKVHHLFRDNSNESTAESLPDSTASYSAISCPMMPQSEIKDRSSSEHLYKHGYNPLDDETNSQDSSGGSFLSNYRQVPNDDDDLEDLQEEKLHPLDNKVSLNTIHHIDQNSHVRTSPNITSYSRQ